MFYNIVVDKTTSRVVEIGDGGKERFRAEPERYLITVADVPDSLARQIFRMGWDGEKIITIDPPKGHNPDGSPINTEPSVTVDEQIAHALEKQRQEFIDMFRKSGITIS